jgi:hypothetical protein
LSTSDWIGGCGIDDVATGASFTGAVSLSFFRMFVHAIPDFEVASASLRVRSPVQK